MADAPKPYEVPEGMTLTTIDEVRKAGVCWRHVNQEVDSIRHKPDVAPAVPHGTLVLAYPPEPVMVSIDVKHLKAMTSYHNMARCRYDIGYAPAGPNQGRFRAALEAFDAIVGEADRA